MTVTLSTALRYEPANDTTIPGGFDKRDFEHNQGGAAEVYGAVIAVPSASEADLDTSMLPSVSGVYLENVGSNIVTYGPKSGGVMVPLATIEPGQYVYLNLTGTLRWQAATSPTNVKIWLFE